MNLTIFDTVQQNPSASCSIDPGSLYHALEQVKDERKRRGKRYPLALIFTLLLLGKLAGETTIEGIVEWVELREGWFKQALDWPRRFPSNAAYTRALASCNAEELVHVIAGVMLKAHVSEPQKGTERLRSMGKRCAAHWGMSLPISQRCMCSPGTIRTPEWCWPIAPSKPSTMRSVA